MIASKLKDLSKIKHDYGKEPIKNKLLDCSLGSNPFGCSPKVLEVLENIRLEDIYKYPQSNYKTLKERLVEYWDNEFKVDDLFIGNGSMGCLEKINKLLKPNSTVLGYSPQFLPYINDVIANGAVYEYVPLKKEEDFEIRIDKIIERLSENVAFLYVDNPNNPTGQVIKLKDIEELVEEAERRNIVVIVDEAYGDFMPKKNSAINLNYENLVVVRSFSKGFGLAGVRVGYCVVKGKVLKRLISKVDIPFSVTAISEKIAIKSLEDREFVENSIREVRERKIKLLKALNKKFHIGKTSFSTPIFLCGGREDTYSYFLNRGILTVSGEEYLNLDDSYVRIRVPKEVDVFLRKISLF